MADEISKHDDQLAPYWEADRRVMSATKPDELAILRAVVVRLRASVSPKSAEGGAMPLSGHADATLRRGGRLGTRRVFAVPLAALVLGLGAAVSIAASAGYWVGAGRQPPAAAAPSKEKPPSPSVITTGISAPADASLASAPSDDADHVALEALIIDHARAALQRGLLGEAEATLARHLAGFGRGQLAEERDVLWIELCLAQGDNAGAARRLTNYRRDYPRGFLRGRVEQLAR